MKICFLVPPALDGHPPAERIFGCNYGIYNQPNIFMVYVATYLRDRGHRVFIKDCVIEGISPSGFESFIRSDDSDLYFFSTVFLSKVTDLKAREIIRKLKPAARFCYYSTEPTGQPRDFVAPDTFVVRGEPEVTSGELLNALEKGSSLDAVRGLVFSKEGQMLDTGYREPLEDLDVLPFPDRSLLPKKNYNNPKLSRYPFTTVLTSRGCPYRCYYCVPNSLSFTREIDIKRESGEITRKPKYRSRSVANAVKEIRGLAAEGYKAFTILDDIFAVNPAWTIEFCRGIEDLGMEWSCLSRADHMTNPEMVMAMGRAGCKVVSLGVESLDPAILKAVKKDLDLATVPVAVANMKRAGIEVEVNVLIAASDLETEKTIRDTFEKVKALDPDYVMFSACTPFPYTEFSQVARAKGWAIHPEYRPVDPVKRSSVSYPHLSKEKIEKTLRRMYLGFYYRPSFLWNKLTKVKSLKDLLNKARAALTIFR